MAVLNGVLYLETVFTRFSVRIKDFKELNKLVRSCQILGTRSRDAFWSLWEKKFKMSSFNVMTAYLLWGTLGWLWVHHLYLRRDRQAFVRLWTVGGFGIGWFLELWRIPFYVSAANVVYENAGSTIRRGSVLRKPPFNIKRFLGDIAFSSYLGYLAISVLPKEVLLMGQYCLFTTYIIWLTLGLFGGHHSYLNNDHQGFVWLWTCGGFVFGWLSEMWQIQSYVLAAEVEFQKAGLPIHHISVHNRPFRIKRIVGEIAFSVYLGYLTISALPIKALFDFPWTSSVIGAFAVATGVHTVANIGREECKFSFCLLGTFLHFPIFFFGTMDNPFTYIIFSALLSTVCATFWGRRSQTKYPARRPMWERLVILIVSSAGMLSLFLFRIYFHGDIQ